MLGTWRPHVSRDLTHGCIEQGILGTSNIENENKSFEYKSGSILCVGYAIGKFYSTKREMNINVSSETQLKPLIESVVKYLGDHYLSYSAIVSFGEIARNGDTLLCVDDVA